MEGEAAMSEFGAVLPLVARGLREALRAAPDGLRADERELAERLLALPREQSAEISISAALTRERIRVTRAHGSAAAELVDACLVLRLLESGEERRRATRAHAWVSFLDGVLRGADALCPPVLYPRLKIRPGPLRVLAASMRAYFRAGDYWCERTGIPRRWILEARGGSGLRVARYIATQMGGFRPVWQTHLPPLAPGVHLTEERYARSHLLIAQAMRLHPRIRGIASSSWYYDPAVGEVSPRLACIGRLLSESGCLCFEIPIDAPMRESALLRSAARRAAFERGEYVPRDFARLWSRDAVLRWAERQPGWQLRRAVSA
jgi:hypothetical protein